MNSNILHYSLTTRMPSALTELSDLSLIKKNSDLVTGLMNSRHWFLNETTKFLDELEQICASTGNDSALRMLQKMVVLDAEHIKIGNYIHKFGSVNLPVNKSKNIYSKFGHTILSYRAAMEYIFDDKQYTMYSESELLGLFHKFPEVIGYNKAQILVKVLQIPLIGWRSPGFFDALNGSVHRDNVQILTSSQDNGQNAMCTLSPNTPGQKIHFGYHNSSRNLGILLVHK